MMGEAGQDWPELKEYLRATLSRERELSGSTPFAGRVVLSEEDRWTLFHAETLKIVYLQQNALSTEDACLPLASLAAMLRLLKALDDKVRKFLREGLRFDDVASVFMRQELTALRDLPALGDKGREWLDLVSARLTIELTAKQVDDQEEAQ